MKVVKDSGNNWIAMTIRIVKLKLIILHTYKCKFQLITHRTLLNNYFNFFFLFIKFINIFFFSVLKMYLYKNI